MIETRTFATCAVGLVLLTRGVNGQAVSQYRNFELGVNVAAVSALTGLATSDAKTIHQRPALLQDLEWRPSHWRASDTLPSTDPVQQIGFSFYNVWMIAGLAVFVAIEAIVRWRRSGRQTDLGFVSQQWVAENRLSQQPEPRR